MLYTYAVSRYINHKIIVSYLNTTKIVEETKSREITTVTSRDSAYVKNQY